MTTKHISGFPEWLPQEQIAWNQVVHIIQEQFELHGFAPLDTAAVERTSALLSKGNDHEIYGLHRLADPSSQNDKDLALRFDLTVPLARYVAQNYGQLTFPYRRYQMAPVWRGERPQAGRYRQFYQCDVDVVGEEELPLVYDAEMIAIVYKTLSAIGLKRFVININNRLVLTGFLKSINVCDTHILHVMRLLDKADKVDVAVLQHTLHTQHGISYENITQLINMMHWNAHNADKLTHLKALCRHPEFTQGLNELTEVVQQTRHFGVPDTHICLEPTLARGLTYYTGTVLETRLLDWPVWGSVCGGGRYGNLIQHFGKRILPGVGVSIGLSRLMPKLIESDIVKLQRATPAVVLVTVQNPDLLLHYLNIAHKLRNHHIKTEIYLSRKPLAHQMKFAHRKGFTFVVIAREEEINAQKWIVRSLRDGEQHSYDCKDAINHIRRASSAAV